MRSIKLQACIYKSPGQGVSDAIERMDEGKNVQQKGLLPSSTILLWM